MSLIFKQIVDWELKNFYTAQVSKMRMTFNFKISFRNTKTILPSHAADKKLTSQLSRVSPARLPRTSTSARFLGTGFTIKYCLYSAEKV